MRKLEIPSRDIGFIDVMTYLVSYHISFEEKCSSGIWERKTGTGRNFTTKLGVYSMEEIEELEAQVEANYLKDNPNTRNANVAVLNVVEMFMSEEEQEKYFPELQANYLAKYGEHD